MSEQLTLLRRLLALYQIRLAIEIDDKRNFEEERTGLRMAAAMFRACLKDLGIDNVEGHHD